MNLAGCGFLVTKILTNDKPVPVAEVSTASVDTTEAVTTTAKQTETTTTTKATTTTKNTTTTKKETTTEAETTTAETTKTEKTTKPDEPAGNSASAYYETHKKLAFQDNPNDPFCPPGLYTRLNNEDGAAIQKGNAIAAMNNLGVDWDGFNAVVFEDVPDGNGTSDSQYRFVTEAYPVPLIGKSLPAAVDLGIHNGSGNHGNYLRSIEYFFGNHVDDRSGYIWTKNELYSVYSELNDKIADRLGGGDFVSGGSYEGYQYTTAGGGFVELYFYSNGDDTYMIRLIRSNN